MCRIIGMDRPRGMGYIPSNIWLGCDLCNHPPMLCIMTFCELILKIKIFQLILEIFCPYVLILAKKLPILNNFNKKFSPNAKFELVKPTELRFFSSPFLNLHPTKYSINCTILFQNYKNFHILMGHIPLRHPWGYSFINSLRMWVNKNGVKVSDFEHTVGMPFLKVRDPFLATSWQ